jgi:uncharacterized protein (TIGR02757 family)
LYPATLKDFLDAKVAQYNRPAFIEDDPIAIPHRYEKREDIEIAGLFAAVLAWGRRGVAIRKCQELLDRMDDAPHAFIIDHQPADLQRLSSFKHRTFNGTDALYFVRFLRHCYQQYTSLEELFLQGMSLKDTSVESGLVYFHRVFFSLPYHPVRTRKHIATPANRAACKRMNMFLRWMVRKDHGGVDFGLWQNIQPNQLICPCDVHVGRVARKLGLLRCKTIDWQVAKVLTKQLSTFCPEDPVKYDFALFGLGIMEDY